VVVEAGEATYVLEVAPPIWVVHEAPVYHVYPYGVVPPEGFEVNVIDCPLSIIGEDGVIAPAPRAEFTVTVSPAEHALAAGVPELLSVTL
jgi:hypothetical protein